MSFKSLVDRSRIWQNGPASQHVRKEPAKNRFFVDFHLELTAQRLFSSDLPPSPKSLVVYTKRRSSLPKILFPTYLSCQPHPSNHWLIGIDFGRSVQPVNTSGRNQLKTSLWSIFALNWQHSASSPLTCPHSPNLWFVQGKHSLSTPQRNSCPQDNIPC